MATRLTDMIVDEVSFVKRGANQEANIVLFKRDDGVDKGCGHTNMKDGDSNCPDCGLDSAMVGKAAPSGSDVHTDTASKKLRPKVAGEDKDEDEDDEGAAYVQPPSKSVPSSPPKAKDEPKPAAPAMKPKEPAVAPEVDEEEPPAEDYEESDDDEDEEKPMRKSDLPEVLQKHVEGDPETEVTTEVLEAATTAANAEAVTTATQEAEVEKSAEEEGLPVEIAKADPAIQALWKSQQEAIDQATTIAKAERDARLTKEFTEVAKTFTNLTVDADEFGVVLKGLNEADPDIYEQVVTVLKGANEASANLFKSVGQSPVGDQSGSSLSAIEKAAAAVRSENPELTAAEAEDIALQRDPDLYSQYISETTGA